MNENMDKNIGTSVERLRKMIIKKSIEHLKIMGNTLEGMNDLWDNQGRIRGTYG